MSMGLGCWWSIGTSLLFKVTRPVYPELEQIMLPPYSYLVQGWNHGGLLSTSRMVISTVVEALYDGMMAGGVSGVSYDEGNDKLERGHHPCTEGGGFSARWDFEGGDFFLETLSIKMLIMKLLRMK